MIGAVPANASRPKSASSAFSLMCQSAPPTSSVAPLEKFQDVSCVLTGEPGTHAHVRHDHFPLVVAKLPRIARVTKTPKRDLLAPFHLVSPLIHGHAEAPVQPVPPCSTRNWFLVGLLHRFSGIFFIRRAVSTMPAAATATAVTAVTKEMHANE